MPLVARRTVIQVLGGLSRLDGGYGFGNWCTRIVAPGGRIQVKTDALIRDTGQPDMVAPGAGQHAVQDLIPRIRGRRWRALHPRHTTGW
jgi:hypothetical protein